jgi:hypothetical protein
MQWHDLMKSNITLHFQFHDKQRCIKQYGTETLYY